MENVEEMVGTREAAAVATESGGWATTGGDGWWRDGGDRWGYVYGRREVRIDEDEMAALEVQRLVAKLFPDFGSEPDFEGFHVSEPAGILNGGDGSESEAVTESDDDEGVAGRLSDAAAAAAY